MSNCHHFPANAGSGAHLHPCSCCSLSRRSFLGAAAACTAALATGCNSLESLHTTPKPNETIDLASFRPRPKVRIMSVVARQKTPYWLGWPGASYPVEGERQRYNQVIADSGQRIGVQIAQEAQPLEDQSAVATFVKKVQAEKPDAVIVMLQHLTSGWPAAAEIAKTGVPTIVFAPVGTAFTGHVNRMAFQPGVHVISSLETPALEQALRMVRAWHQLGATRMLVVRGNERKEDKFGPVSLQYVPRATFEEMFSATPVSDEAQWVARQRFREARKVVEPTQQDGLNAARSYIAAKQLLKNEGCNALTTDCLGMVTQKKVPTPPCMGASLFQDGGVTYGCEAAVGPAVSLMLTSYLFDKPGFMNDPVPETVKNVLIAAHCVSGTRIYGLDRQKEHAPYILRSHSESNLGVSTQVLWPVGQPVTLVQFFKPDALYLDTGTVVGNLDTPPAGGCRTSVEIQMDNVEDSRDVLGFHQVVFLGNHRRDIEAFCQMYGINVVHSARTHEETIKPAAKPAKA
ncbi:MAG: twin-arginine translocation signal domain-containing protein [Planctomycetes bacterium]|nr:twin-arginine translocation signal domain-containing protein [Planctomycetota bacterium]